MSLSAETTRIAALWFGVFALGIAYIVRVQTAGRHLAAVVGRLVRARRSRGSIAMRVVLRGAAAWVRAQVASTCAPRSSSAPAMMQAASSKPSSATAGPASTCAAGSTRRSIPGNLKSVPHLGGLDSLAHYVETTSINQVWIALPMSAQEQINAVVEALDHSTTDIKFVPDLFGLQLLNHSVEQVAGLPVINLRASRSTATRACSRRRGPRAGRLLILDHDRAAARGDRHQRSSAARPARSWFRQKAPRPRRQRTSRVWKFRIQCTCHAEARGRASPLPGDHQPR
jgi:FlaA1/EpsC-like NDP-sugar epimerase